jgi:hypothetical protein
MKAWWFLKAAKFIAFAIVGFAVFGYVVMGLWNWLLPELFHGPVITFWQAVGILLLSHILLRGGASWHHKNGWHRGRWKHRMEEKLAAMTPEEREKYKEEWKRRCGYYPYEDSEKKDTASKAP